MAIKKSYSINSVLGLLFVIFFVVTSCSTKQQVNPSNALQHYIHNGDTTYHWSLRDTFSIGSLKGYDLLLVSQQWRQYTWKHQLTILSPKENDYDGALLFITGGSNDTTTEMPHWVSPNDDLTQAMGKMAAKNHAIVAIIRQVPNEPLFGGLVEDQIISYTFHKFEKTHDYTWPLLFPMVKSAIRGMDAVQSFSKSRLDHPIKRFVVSGASKRGWTTWLTAASGDPRVAAIAPMVIDVLNMPVNLAHQKKAYGGFSKEIHDYVKLGIVQGITSASGEKGVSSKNGKELLQMVDPYSYRKKLTMPKLLFMGTNDPYWVIDNVKNYLPGIPGENLINYTPNVGHDRQWTLHRHKSNKGVVPYPALSAFFGITLEHGKYPKCSWETKVEGNKIQLTVKASKDILVGAKIWHASSKDKDFRNDKFTSRDLNVSHQSEVKATVSLPTSGYLAFYMALTYKNPNGGTYIVCTRAFMADTHHIFPSIKVKSK